MSAGHAQSGQRSGRLQTYHLTAEKSSNAFSAFRGGQSPRLDESPSATHACSPFTPQLKECTFKPRINQASVVMMAERSGAQKVLQVSAHEQLYADAVSVKICLCWVSLLGF